MIMTQMKQPHAEPAFNERFPAAGPLATAAADYDIVRRAIAHIRGHWRAQPEIDTIAEAAGVSATDLHHLFRRWCGLTPKAFLQALTLNHAREMLRASASVLEASYEVGLSGPGRLHDLFVTHEAMSPGEWKAGGEGLTITYGFHPCPFGTAIVRNAARSTTCDGVGQRRVMWKISRLPPPRRGAFSTARCGAPSSRCAWY
jgi:AraC family transcriptional regulator of adaptative response/methylated-DNA-[protein]-cysteine methyltransferase